MAASEFSRPVKLDTIGDRPRDLAVEANEAERAALTARFGLAALDSLSGDVRFHKTAAGIRAGGTIRAKVAQPCIATREPVPQTIEERFDLLFVPAATESGEDEIELSAADCDIVEHDGQAIDLGEALAQTLSLALDPFPRAPGADAALREAGVMKEEEAGAFGALAGLKAALEKKGS